MAALRFRDRAADALAGRMGSWSFVIGQAAFLAGWFIWNTVTKEPDPYPFILANLIMSAQAAFATPILLMSQNRQSASDRRTLLEDVKLDRESLEFLRHVAEEVDGLVSRSKEDGAAARERCSGCYHSDAVHRSQHRGTVDRSEDL